MVLLQSRSKSQKTKYQSLDKESCVELCIFVDWQRHVIAVVGTEVKEMLLPSSPFTYDLCLLWTHWSSAADDNKNRVRNASVAVCMDRFASSLSSRFFYYFFYWIAHHRLKCQWRETGATENVNEWVIWIDRLTFIKIFSCCDMQFHLNFTVCSINCSPKCRIFALNGPLAK